MINSLGVLGWGVGGIEAEAVMLGQPLYMLAPQVVGFKLRGALRDGVTATDLTLTVVQMLRKQGVVDKFVEFYGSGLSSMSLPDRATIANMAPEYGATMGFFPTDSETLDYLRRTGRGDAADLVEVYSKTQGLFRTDDMPDPKFSDTLELNLDSVEPSLAGPKRPQDRIAMRELKTAFHKALQAPVAERGYGLDDERLKASVSLKDNGHSVEMHHGAVVIAAITSCTNTSNPSVMVGAGLLAKKAVEAGLSVKPYVKTSMAPGSKVVRDYLTKSGTLTYLEQLGFNIVGYGCTTCIAAGTPVLLANGTTRRIEDMPGAGGGLVFGPTPDGRLALEVQTETITQGLRDCVTLVLQDGRELVCTPDHEILCADGRWVRADRLVPGVDRVLAGLEAPLDEPLADEANYRLIAGELTFALDSQHQRLRALAFARLVGHLLGDGSISAAGQGRLNVGQAVDRELVLNDVELITGKRPAGTQYDERKWAIVLPVELTDAIRRLAGVRVGRRIQQPPALPAFVLDDRCPVALVREFLGGVFGADGQAPVLHRLSGREEDAVLEAPAYSQTAQPEHVQPLKELMQAMIGLLDRCGVQTTGARVYEYPVRRAATSYPAAVDGLPRVEVRLKLPDGLSFVERVGFRYCVDKALRASAAAVYWRTVDRINDQRLNMSARLETLHQEHSDLSFSRARSLAASELSQRETAVFPHYSLLEGHDRFGRLPKPADRQFRPLHRDSCRFPSPIEFFEQMGVRDWFAPLQARADTDYAKRYCVEKNAGSLPTFSLQLLDRRPAGERMVFDLSVNNLHAFVAGGICVHNCIGNSGPLPEAVAEAVREGDLVSAAVISGNRNFEGRVHPLVKANFLASPPLVVAYALAGTTDIDLTHDPLGTGKNGQPVYLHDIWPSQKEVADAIAASIDPDMFVKSYQNVFLENETWNNIPVSGGELYAWSPASTYIHQPPFFEGMTVTPEPLKEIRGARVLGSFGDSITTDHISPAGNIAKDCPAGRYLIEQGVEPRDFNQYGTRRGNHEVMLRGTFANIRLKNLLLGGEEGGNTLHLPDGAKLSIYDAAMQYRQEGVPLIVLTGKEYGTGSSRDWAAKGTLLLGVRAVIAESFERIHRSNLVGMGVLPLVFQPDESAGSLGLTGREQYDILGVDESIHPRQTLTVRATADDGRVKTFTVVARLDTPVEVDYYKNGGILPTVLRNLVKQQ
jgi:aconitase A